MESTEVAVGSFSFFSFGLVDSPFGCCGLDAARCKMLVLSVGHRRHWKRERHSHAVAVWGGTQCITMSMADRVGSTCGGRERHVSGIRCGTLEVN